MAAASVLTAVSAHAAPPPDADSALAPWYRGLMQPGTHISCCSLADCRPVDYRYAGGDIEARADGKWIDVPASVVLKRTENPTGRGVLCGVEGTDGIWTVFCFVEASGA